MENVSILSSFLNMLFALAIVVGILIGVMYFIKRFMQRNVTSVDNQALINVVSSYYLGPKSSIVLVEVMERLIVVGISGQQMTPLAQIDDPLSVARIKSQKTTAKPNYRSGDAIARLLSLANLSSRNKTDNSVK